MANTQLRNTLSVSLGVHNGSEQVDGALEAIGQGAAADGKRRIQEQT